MRDLLFRCACSEVFQMKQIKHDQDSWANWEGQCPRCETRWEVKSK